MKRIGIHGVPRSGTTWIGNIFNSNPFIIYKHQPLYSYEFKNFLTNSSKKENIIDFFEKISKSDDDYINQKTLVKDGLVPFFQKKDSEESIIVYKEARHHHILETLLKEDDEFMLVCIIRNPFATLWSWKNAPNEFKEGWDFQKEWRYAELKNMGLPENFYGYEKWKESSLQFHRLKETFSDRVQLINYGEFIKNPLDNIIFIFNKIGIPMDTQVNEFITKSKSKSKGVYSVFRDKIVDNDWVGNIDDYIIEYIKSDLANSELKQYL